MTQLSKSTARSARAIGNSCVIPAQAGIQRRFHPLSKSTARSARAIGNSGAAVHGR